jgi:hypothetical protein
MTQTSFFIKLFSNKSMYLIFEMLELKNLSLIKYQIIISKPEEKFFLLDNISKPSMMLDFQKINFFKYKTIRF